MTTPNKVTDLFNQSVNDSDLSAKQKSVLQASLTLFSEKGFDRTSTSDIAKLANVSEGTVYKQFKTKEGLLHAILTPAIQQVVPKIANDFLTELLQNNNTDFKDFLKWLAQDRMTFAVENQAQLRILIQEIARSDGMFKRLGDTFMGKIAVHANTLFQKYQDNGQLIQWPMPRIARYIASAIMGYILPVILRNDHNLDIAQSSEEVAEFLYRGLKP